MFQAWSHLFRPCAAVTSFQPRFSLAGKLSGNGLPVAIGEHEALLLMLLLFLEMVDAWLHGSYQREQMAVLPVDVRYTVVHLPQVSTTRLAREPTPSTCTSAEVTVTAHPATSAWAERASRAPAASVLLSPGKLVWLVQLLRCGRAGGRVGGRAGGWAGGWAGGRADAFSPVTAPKKTTVVYVCSTAGRQLIGLLCYDRCPSGYTMVLGALRCALNWLVSSPEPNAANARHPVHCSHFDPVPALLLLQAPAGNSAPAGTPTRASPASRLGTQRAAADTLPPVPPAGAHAPAGAPTWERRATLVAPPAARAAAASGACAGPNAAADGELLGDQELGLQCVHGGGTAPTAAAELPPSIAG